MDCRQLAADVLVWHAYFSSLFLIVANLKKWIWDLHIGHRQVLCKSYFDLESYMLSFPYKWNLGTVLRFSPVAWKQTFYQYRRKSLKYYTQKYSTEEARCQVAQVSAQILCCEQVLSAVYFCVYTFCPFENTDTELSWNENDLPSVPLDLYLD